MRITSKGQVTIPQNLRERYGLLPSMEVKFMPLKDGIKIVASGGESSRGDALVEHMRGRGHKRLSADELMKMTRGDD